ncbi:hypothetical protein [Lentimicrobium sp. S6]|uniref:hypothetical protein n=1 Tax=Lentimicrobium sp. S6 TaxID=2735872 RepID=UPI0015555FA5|nr:hypothetical protein [Lentimicrobium sp. S6]NPD47489.1 hypothetical protein [Lentimicrobium sp. S6]
MEFIKKNIVLLLLALGAALYFFYSKNKGEKSLKPQGEGLINGLVNKVKPCPEKKPCPKPTVCPEPEIIYKDKIIKTPCPPPPRPQIIYKDKIVEKPVYRDKIVKVPVEKIIYRDRPISTLADKRDLHNSAAKGTKSKYSAFK